MILIGSRALAIRAPFILNRQPKDFDFVVETKEEALDWLKSKNINDMEEEDGKIISRSNMVEFEIANAGSSAELLTHLVKEDSQTIITNGFGIIPVLDLLFTIKSSHKYKKVTNPAVFYKHAMDYHKLKDFGAKVRPEYQEFLKLREKESYAGQKYPKLNVMKEEFFDSEKNNIKQVYVHDDIHIAVKHLDKPAYEYYKKDGAEVECDMKKFFEVAEEVRLYGVLEECYTLSIERSQIPFPGKLSPKQSFLLALAKLASTISSGKFRSFVYDSIPKVLTMYSDDYYEKFQSAVKENRVRKVNF